MKGPTRNTVFPWMILRKIQSFQEETFFVRSIYFIFTTKFSKSFHIEPQVDKDEDEDEDGRISCHPKLVSGLMSESDRSYKQLFPFNYMFLYISLYLIFRIHDIFRNATFTLLLQVVRVTIIVSLLFNTRRPVVDVKCNQAQKK